MAGLEAEDEVQHSPRTRGIISHFERQVRLHTDVLDEDVRVTNERLGHLETSQIAANATITRMEASLGAITTSLTAILQRLEESEAGHPAGAHEGSIADENAHDYAADTEDGEARDARPRRPAPRHRHGNGARPPRREVRDHDDSLGSIKFKMPPFDGKYDPDTYLTWELAVDQKFACFDFPGHKRVRAATSEFTDFASVWWREHRSQNPHNVLETWEALKRVMRARFVPSYYARNLLHKLQQLRQGTQSVEEYYQELQIGLLRCGLVENEEAAMARFVGGLNREIQDILAYKEYNSITHLFHLACKAEWEVQGHRTRSNTSAGRSTSWQSRASTPPTSHAAPQGTISSQPPAPPSKSAPRASEAVKGTTTSSVASTGRTRDI